MGRVCESPCRWIGKPLSSETCRGVWTMNEVEDLMRLMRHWKRSFFSDPIEHIIAVLRFAHYNFFSAFILNTLHTMQWKKCKQLKVLFYYLYYPRHKLKIRHQAEIYVLLKLCHRWVLLVLTVPLIILRVIYFWHIVPWHTHLVRAGCNYKVVYIFQETMQSRLCTIQEWAENAF